MCESLYFDATIAAAQQRLATFLSPLPVCDITPVTPAELKTRTTVRHVDIPSTPDAAVFRIETVPLIDFDILETRGDVITHLRTQLQTMDQNAATSDTRLIATDLPPRHVRTEPLVFYVQSVNK